MFVLCVSKSWLLPSTPSSLVGVSNYLPLRKAVVSNMPKHGVYIHLESSFKYVEISVMYLMW